MTHPTIEQIRKSCIVSCQAFEGEPLYGPANMAAMAQCAAQGGAKGIRANSPQDIAAIRQAVDLPIIGIYKREYPDSEVYITPTYQDVRDIIEAGAEIVALDATGRPRPRGETLAQIIHNIRKHHPETLIMADVSTYDEGVEAMERGVDLVSTTLAGYTAYSPHQDGPDVELVRRLAQLRRVPVIAEGRIWTLEDCEACLAAGAHALVIGGAITRPRYITQRFVNHVGKL